MGLEDSDSIVRVEVLGSLTRALIFQRRERGRFRGELSDAVIELHKTYTARLPTPQSSMHLSVSDRRRRAQRPPRRDRLCQSWKSLASVMVGVDPDPANAALVTEWTKSYHEALHYSAGAAYANFLMNRDGHPQFGGSRP